MTDTPGARLKKIRLAKGLTLEQVHKATKIHVHILEALEGDGITNISPVYLRSFLKIYTKYLGQEPEEFLKPDETKPAQQRCLSQEAPLEKAAPQPRIRRAQREAEWARVRQKISRAAVSQGAQLFKAAGSGLKKLRISPRVRAGIALAAVTFILLWGVIKLGQVATRKIKSVMAGRRKAAVTETVRQASPSSERGVVEAAPPASGKEAAPKPADTAAGTDLSRKDEIKLVIRAKQNCWILLKADGKVVFQRILEKGRFETWYARDKMELSLGNAGGVEIEVDGKVFKNLGRRRQTLKSIVITREGLRVER